MKVIKGHWFQKQNMGAYLEIWHYLDLLPHQNCKRNNTIS